MMDLLPQTNINLQGTVYKCWRKWRREIDKDRRREFDGILIYFW
jgi:hypothetical protein